MPDESLRVPAFCPVCGFLMMGKSTITFYKYGCCVDCTIYFIEGREERWKSGWRPTAEHLTAYKQNMNKS